MRLRPQIACNPLDAPRASGTVRAVAEILSLHQSQVRRLVETGELESFTTGKRGVRIYWDSVADYQARRTRQAARKVVGAPQSPKPRFRRNAASIASHRAALAVLEAA